MVRLFFLIGALVLSTWASEIENPGFFLKVSKNVPRIGRRSEGQSEFNMMYMNPKNIPPPHRRSQLVRILLQIIFLIAWLDIHVSLQNWPNSENSWIRKIRNDNAAPQAYNYVQPFDMQFLFNLLANDSDFDESNLKFISWEDFDKAIESDTQLLKKLYELGKEHRAEQFHEIHDEEPMIHTLGGGQNPGYNHIYYRSERSAAGPAGALGQPDNLMGSTH